MWSSVFSSYRIGINRESTSISVTGLGPSISQRWFLNFGIKSIVRTASWFWLFDLLLSLIYTWIVIVNILSISLSFLRFVYIRLHDLNRLFKCWKLLIRNNWIVINRLHLFIFSYITRIIDFCVNLTSYSFFFQLFKQRVIGKGVGYFW